MCDGVARPTGIGLLAAIPGSPTFLHEQASAGINQNTSTKILAATKAFVSVFDLPPILLAALHKLE